MKSILISINPRFVADILNGKKTVEIRKTMPKCELPIDVYIYCTKCKKGSFCKENGYIGYRLDGCVVAKFTLDKVEMITPEMWSPIKEKEVLNSSCLNKFELYDYISKNNGEPDNQFYAWHISNLGIFDKPKELSEFRKYYRSKGFPQNRSWNLTKAPQSWQFIESEN